MATLKDVAKLACVDVSTVSRALNNTSYVHPDTKARILEAVRELSYEPNVLSQSMRQGKRHTIGVLVPILKNSVFASIVEKIDIEAQKAGYAILLCNSYDKPAVEKECLNRLRNGFIDALIIAATGRNSRLIKDIEASGIPVIQIVREQIPGMSSIVSDYSATAYDAVDYLYRQGARHIGLLCGNTKLVPFHDRYEGYKRAIREMKLQELTTPSSFSGHTFDHGYQGAQDLLFEYPQLDAIIASGDAQCMGALRLLRERHKNIPDEVRIMSLTGSTIDALLETALTAIELPADEIGAQAVVMALDRIDTPSSKPKRLVLPTTLVEREST